MSGSSSSFAGGLLQDTIANIQNLVRSEIQLAKTELRQDAIEVGKNTGMLAAAAVLGLYAGSLVLNAVVELLEEVLPDWLASLVTAVLLGVIAIVLGRSGLERLRQVRPVPQQTIESVQQDIAQVRQQLRQ